MESLFKSWFVFSSLNKYILFKSRSCLFSSSRSLQSLTWACPADTAHHQSVWQYWLEGKWSLGSGSGWSPGWGCEAQIFQDHLHFLDEKESSERASPKLSWGSVAERPGWSSRRDTSHRQGKSHSVLDCRIHSEPRWPPADTDRLLSSCHKLLVGFL